MASLYPVSRPTITKKYNTFLVFDLLSEHAVWTNR